MPCIAKKYERQRPEMKNRDNGMWDVDAVLTTREAARLLRRFNIDIAAQEDAEFDDMMGESSGAARLFAVSGGVMEAALRTIAAKSSSGKLDSVDFLEVRAGRGVLEAVVNIGERELRVAVVNGIGSARAVLDDVERGVSPYHFIEFMACPDGCAGGGGAPIRGDSAVRTESIYRSDAGCTVRRSHENEEVQKLYRDYLGEPGGDKAHKLLHTR
jgi:iron only hydrogenase large subunit-like protein